jgi:hypothetical protein
MNINIETVFLPAKIANHKFIKLYSLKIKELLIL